MTEEEIRRTDRILAVAFDQTGNYASGLDLSPIGEDGHAVASLMWKISGYLKGRAAARITSQEGS
jgi:hypothetical protein